ncbi:MAG TPA: hypothetical protein VFU12_12495 [Glycomyces sp.]|nr:hypothetical protein [Glycomyces sp.]
MVRTRVFGALAATGAALALTFAASGTASAESAEEQMRPEGSMPQSEVDVGQSDDVRQENCAARTGRSEVRIRAEASTDGEVLGYMEPGTWYSASCDSTPGGTYGEPCGDGFHWLEVYLEDTTGYVALMCLDGWTEVDV